MKVRHAGLLSGASLIVIAQFFGAFTASAQNASSGSSDDIEEVVVTGTLIRNVVPVGTAPITMDSAAIQATGAVSTDQLLSTIPQVGTLGNLQTVNSGGVQLTVNRISLRVGPGIGASSPTLILVDGHRIVGEGVKQAYPDPDVIPPDLIDRVEVVPDGGSATYGSDAVGGVINFITKKNFDGIDAGVRQSIGSDYLGTDANVTVGKSWSDGSAYVGYNYSFHNALYGRNRDYIKDVDYATGLPADKNCSPPNAIVNGSLYAVTGGNSLTAGNQNLCDLSDHQAFYPSEKRGSLMVGFRQELTQSLEFSVKGFYSTRNDLTTGGALQASNEPVTAANPNYISTGDANAGANQAIDFNFAPVGGYERIKTNLWSYGITPTVTWEIGSDWEAIAFYNYGQSRTTANDPGVNQADLATDIANGSINPYNVAASNPAAISDVLDYTNYGIGKDTMSNARVTFDGPLFSLPGGELRMAIGGEYLNESFRGTIIDGTYESIATSPLASASRKVGAGFAELNIPVISPDNNVPLINSLTLAASERYDHYSDFGGNWAPNLAATLKPIDWISLRARWNKSFQAPSVLTLAQASSTTAPIYGSAIVNAVQSLVNPAVPYNNGDIVAVMGTATPLEPQRARDLDLGFDISPPFINGLNLHFTYWNINYMGSVQMVPYGFGPFFGVPSFNSLYIMTPTPAQIQTFLASRGVPQSTIDQDLVQVAHDGGAYIVVDDRNRNLGATHVNGFDFGFDYTHDTSFGTAYANFSGTYTNNTVAAADGVTFQPNTAGTDGAPRMTFVGVLGATVGDNFRGQITWNHRDGFKLVADPAYNQTHVSAFDTFDLYTEYDLNRADLPPLEFSLGVTNMFDTNPPVYRGQPSGQVAGYWNGSTLGRVFQLGVSVKY